MAAASVVARDKSCVEYVDYAVAVDVALEQGLHVIGV